MTGRLSRRTLGTLVVVAALAAAESAAHAQDSFDGVVVFTRIAELRAGVSGIIDLDAPPPGGTFEAGSELARVSASVYRGRLDSAEKRAAVVRAELEEAQKTFERNQVLYDEGSLSTVDFDLAHLQLTRAAAAVSQAESDLASARSAAGLSRIRAPFAGVVLDVALADGTYVNAATTAPLVLTVAAQDGLAARIEVDAATRRALDLGDPARVGIEARVLDGTVAAIRYAGPDAASAWRVDVAFDPGEGNVVAGQGARVEFP